jgi:hypothetical protein
MELFSLLQDDIASVIDEKVQIDRTDGERKKTPEKCNF